MTGTRAAIVIAIVMFAALSPAGAQRGRGPAALAVVPLEAPPAVGSASPHLSSNGTRTILSWLEGSGARTALKYSERTGDGWSPVQTIINGAQLLVNWADVPSVQPLTGAALAAQWQQDNGGD